MLGAGARQVVVVIGPDDEPTARAAFAGLEGWRLTLGGAARVDSTRAGLKALSSLAPESVLIHDAARPFLTADHIDRLLAALEHTEGAILALPAVDTIKRTGETGAAPVTVDRNGLMRAQTPQAFRFAPLLSAFAAWPADETPTDDAQIVERAGGIVALVEGDPMLMKLTYPEDFAMAERLAGGARVTRIGQGFDAHRFGPGDGVWLCGVKIAHDRALIGHSDADAGLHALTDALLGAIGEGDIGDHFPPSDPQWKGAASSAFLAHAMAMVAARGGRVINVDVTLICERPKIKLHREAMRARVAEILGLPLDRVSVKATTTEAMGFTGREEGLAAQAVAAVETPI
jgi:2-C-methyl-D-erythritol 4-phosphate cytidylyltransferase/2-C-methyl-D-erythritol 2,4-cyclodiphosphate synthase